MKILKIVLVIAGAIAFLWFMRVCTVEGQTRFQSSLAMPSTGIASLQELAKFGQASFSYMPEDIGATVQVLHIEHHLLFYAAGLTTDINRDGMFTIDIGLSCYQTVNDQHPFIFAPFTRLTVRSSFEPGPFIYATGETTVNRAAFFSGMSGIGYRVDQFEFIAGIQHEEISDQDRFLQVNGLQGVITFFLK